MADHPGEVQFRDCCQDCGTPLTSGGVAMACGPEGRSTTIRLADWCNDADCRKARDERAMRNAILKGLINP